MIFKFTRQLDICQHEYKAMNEIDILAEKNGKHNLFPKMMSAGNIVVLDPEF